MLIERPSEKRNGNSVDKDLTDDRMIHLRGRTIGETKIVVNGQFDYPKGKLQSARLKFVGTSEEYAAQQQQEETAKSKNVKTRFESLSDSEIDVFNKIGSKRNGLEQKYIPGSKGTVSKALKSLTAEPPLVIKDEETGKWSRHPQADERINSPYHLQDV